MKLLKNKAKSISRAAQKHRHELKRAAARKRHAIRDAQHEIEDSRYGLFGLKLQAKRESDKANKKLSKKLKKGVLK